MNYNTFAAMKNIAYKRLVQEYPEYQRCLIKHIVDKYRDPRVNKLIAMVRRVEFFDKCHDEIAFDMIFSMQPLVVGKDQIIMSIG